MTRILSVKYNHLKICLSYLAYTSYSSGFIIQESFLPFLRKAHDSIIHDLPLTTISVTQPPLPETTLKNGNNNIYNELQEVSHLIRYHDKLYYTTGLTPIISDTHYDALTKREEEICKKYPMIWKKYEEKSGLGSNSTRFGGRVGSSLGLNETVMTNPVAGRVKRQHIREKPMLSLDNAMDDHDVMNWLNRVRKKILVYQKKATNIDHKNGIVDITIMTEPKLDGLAVSLRYEKINDSANFLVDQKYQFVWGATRGDGSHGEDVTDALLTMMEQQAVFHDNTALIDTPIDRKFVSVPRHFYLGLGAKRFQNIPYPRFIEIRGEVILPRFHIHSQSNSNKSLKHTNEKKFTTKSTGIKPPIFNARNVASGILLRRCKEANEKESAYTRIMRSYLRFYAYEIVSSDISTSSFSTCNSQLFRSSGIECRHLLFQLGFSVPTPSHSTFITLFPHRSVSMPDIQHLIYYHKDLMCRRKNNHYKHNYFLHNTSNNHTSNTYSSQCLSLDYDIDGIVYKLASMSQRNILGSSTRYPRWAIAHKFPAEYAITRIRDIQIYVGRTGSLTPVAILDPVKINGVTVKRATLHNFQHAQSILIGFHHMETSQNDFISDFTVPANNMTVDNNKKVGFYSGVSVIISRSGDVLPKILHRLDMNHTYDNANLNKFISLSPPLACPACGSPTVFDYTKNIIHANTVITPSEIFYKSSSCIENSKNDKYRTDNHYFISSKSSDSGYVLRCGAPTLHCRPKTIGTLAHAYSREGLDIRGMSQIRLRQLIDAELLRYPSDIFRILNDNNEFLNKVSSLPGWGTKSSQKLKDTTKSVVNKGISLTRFIYSLGIRHLGCYKSKLIASTYGTVSTFLNDVQRVSDYFSSSVKDKHFVPFPRLRGVGEQKCIRGVGPNILESLNSFSKDYNLVNDANTLSNVVPVHTDNVHMKPFVHKNKFKIKDNPLRGKSIVFSGNLHKTMSRKKAKDLALNLLGAKMASGILRKTTDIIIEGGNSGGKIYKGKELGIEIMSATSFIELIQKYENS